MNEQQIHALFVSVLKSQRDLLNSFITVLEKKPLFAITFEQIDLILSSFEKANSVLTKLVEAEENKT